MMKWNLEPFKMRGEYIRVGRTSQGLSSHRGHKAVAPRGESVHEQKEQSVFHSIGLCRDLLLQLAEHSFRLG